MTKVFRALEMEMGWIGSKENSGKEKIESLLADEIGISKLNYSLIVPLEWDCMAYLFTLSIYLVGCSSFSRDLPLCSFT